MSLGLSQNSNFPQSVSGICKNGTCTCPTHFLSYLLIPFYLVPRGMMAPWGGGGRGWSVMQLPALDEIHEGAHEALTCLATASRLLVTLEITESQLVFEQLPKQQIWREVQILVQVHFVVSWYPQLPSFGPFSMLSAHAGRRLLSSVQSTPFTSKKSPQNPFLSP